MKNNSQESFYAVHLQLLVGPTSEGRGAKEYRSNGLVEFIPNVDPTEPVDPENPDPEKPVKPIDPTDPEGPNPGTQGPLSIDYASSFVFGKNRISNKDQVYFARAQQYQENQKIHQILCKFLIIEEPIVVGL